MKNTSIIALTLLAFALCFYSAYDAKQKVKASMSEYVTCAMIGNQEIAQRDYSLYLSDPIAFKEFKNLDGDHDGVVCEVWKKKK